MTRKRRDSRNRSQSQKKMRRRRGEKAYIFDKDLVRCLGEVEREEWEFAIVSSSGDTAQAARYYGIEGVKKGAKALWGTSSRDALATYRRWRLKRGNKK